MNDQNHQKRFEEVQSLGEHQNLRLLDDGTIVGTLDLMFTRAVVIDLDYHGYARRYCYKDRALAVKACLSLNNGDEEPLPGFIAQRPEKR